LLTYNKKLKKKSINNANFVNKIKHKDIKIKMNLEQKNFILPSEITNITRQLYLNKDIVPLISSYSKDISLNINNDGEFCQDPSIFLKLFSEDYAIKFKSGLDLSLFNVVEIPAQSANDYGGNFISSPSNIMEGLPGSIFYFNNINPRLISELKSKVKQNLVELHCSFTFKEERHIDECMCFMPYGTHYKVWIYKIRNITYGEQLKQILTPSCDLKKIMDKIAIIANNDINSKRITDAGKILLDSESSIEQKISSIDIISSRLLPVEISHLKQELIKDPHIEFLRNPENIKKQLETERQYNLKLIADNLFPGIIDVSNFFVEFPIDLHVDIHGCDTSSPQIKITNIPIFNRLWIELDNKVILLFSIGLIIDKDINDILTREIANIASLINKKKPIDIDYINTQYYNDKGSIGGNLHCLVKNKY
jgi:hypothetical protein